MNEIKRTFYCLNIVIYFLFIYLFIYLLQTTVGPYTYRTVENTQYKAGNRKETHRDYPWNEKAKI